MANKTEGVRVLVQDILRTIHEPYSADIIQDVCSKIEKNSEWLRRYKELGEELRPWVVNNWIGKHVKDLTGMKSVRQVPAKEVKIITSYTKLSR